MLKLWSFIWLIIFNYKDGLLKSTSELLEGGTKSKKKTVTEEKSMDSNQTAHQTIKIYLKFKKFIYDERKKIIQ